MRLCDHHQQALIWTSQARGSGVRAGAPGGHRGIHECECANEDAECPQSFVQGTFCLVAQKKDQTGLVSLHGVPLEAEPPCCQREWPIMSVSPVSVSSVHLYVCVCLCAHVHRGHWCGLHQLRLIDGQRNS